MKSWLWKAQLPLWIALGTLAGASISPGGLATAQTSGTTGSTPAGNRDGIVQGLRKAALPLKGSERDYDELLQMVGDARFVLLGEATHGTEEFYRERARITRRLVAEKGFTAVAIEGDWPDAFRVNRYVRGMDKTAGQAEQALSGFTRFPRWMWRNTQVRDLVEWMRVHNANRPAASQVGFYGLDLYSLPSSADAVVQHLQSSHAPLAQQARERYRCFAAYRNEPERYGVAALSAAESSCTTGAVQQLQDLQQLHQSNREKKASPQITANNAAQSTLSSEELFSALQNARVVKNAEEYYRIMYTGAASSWNLRDAHMTETLQALSSHLEANGRPGKVVVWAHNSHVGDARMTTMGESGEWTLGQLMRQRHLNETFLLGFTSYTGTVMAASEWGAEGHVQRVRPALPGSFAALFHATGVGNFFLPLRGEGELVLAMGEPRLERAIGVIYLPQTERQSHYFQARMSKQFDAVIHLDTTSALQPLR